jgi:hypothetical protein
MAHTRIAGVSGSVEPDRHAWPAAGAAPGLRRFWRWVGGDGHTCERSGTSCPAPTLRPGGAADPRGLRWSRPGDDLPGAVGQPGRGPLVPAADQPCAGVERTGHGPDRANGDPFGVARDHPGTEVDGDPGDPDANAPFVADWPWDGSRWHGRSPPRRT